MNEAEALKLYDDYLDAVYGQVVIGPYEYGTSDALKSTDPIAYREGFLNYCDNEKIELN